MARTPFVSIFPSSLGNNKPAQRVIEHCVKRKPTPININFCFSQKDRYS